VGFHAKLPGLRGGFLGVDVFFVLSGFLITGLLLAEIGRTGEIRLGAFFVRRTIRLVPALALMLAGFALAAPYFFPDVNLSTELALSGLFVSNISYAFSQMPDLTRHTWSLATEMQFYLVWPLVLLVLRRLPVVTLLPVLIALFVAATAWRIVQFDVEGWTRAYNAPDTRLSGFLLGAVAATLPARFPRPLGMAALALGAVLLGYALASSRFTWPIAMNLTISVAEIGTFLMIVALREPDSLGARLLGARPLVLLGTWSYGIYLWHYPIARWMEQTYDTAPFEFAATLALATALAALSYTLVEEPLRRWWRERAVPSPA